MSDVSNKHPEYTADRLAEWQLCADAFNGESAIKRRTEAYLSKPSGYSTAAGYADNGLAAYE